MTVKGFLVIHKALTYRSKDKVTFYSKEPKKLASNEIAIRMEIVVPDELFVPHQIFVKTVIPSTGPINMTPAVETAIADAIRNKTGIEVKIL